MLFILVIADKFSQFNIVRRLGTMITIKNGLWQIEWSRDPRRHVTLKGQGRDPNARICLGPIISKMAGVSYSEAPVGNDTWGERCMCLHFFYRAMHVVLARYCYRMSSVRLSVHLSVRL